MRPALTQAESRIMYQVCWMSSGLLAKSSGMVYVRCSIASVSSFSRSSNAPLPLGTCLGASSPEVLRFAAAFGAAFVEAAFAAAFVDRLRRGRFSGRPAAFVEAAFAAAFVESHTLGGFAFVEGSASGAGAAALAEGSASGAGSAEPAPLERAAAATTKSAMLPPRLPPVPLDREWLLMRISSMMSGMAGTGRESRDEERVCAPS